jgi:hypothetical protein
MRDSWSVVVGSVIDLSSFTFVKGIHRRPSVISAMSCFSYNRRFPVIMQVVLII